MIVLVTSRLCFQEGESHSRDLLQALRKLREALVHGVVSIHHSRWLSTVWVAPLTGGHLGARQGQGNGIGFKSPTQSPMTPMEISTDIYKTRALQQYFSVYWMDQTMPGCVGDSDGGECVLLLICCHWPTLRPTRHTWESCSGSTLEPSPAQPSQPSPAHLLHPFGVRLKSIGMTTTAPQWPQLSQDMMNAMSPLELSTNLRVSPCQFLKATTRCVNKQEWNWWCKNHNRQPALRIFDNQTVHELWSLVLLPCFNASLA